MPQGLSLPTTFDSAAPVDAPLLDVRDLCTEFRGRGRTVRAVDHVSLTVGHGETVGLVGESGSGKSVTALSLVRLLPGHGRTVSGEVIFEGRDILAMSKTEVQRVRGRRIGFIFQDPMTSLNPTLTVGYQIAESARVHLGLSRKNAQQRTLDLLGRVGIPRPSERMDDYPHQFSGGMRQRVMIAIALACDPVLLIADEPTTALDVTIQAQILELIRSLSTDFGTSVILITHDLGVAAGMCDRVNVMYAGQLVESAPVDKLFDRPAMPYTGALLTCLPRLEDPPDEPFTPIEGMPPDLSVRTIACRFSPRCTHARDVCRSSEPAMSGRGPGRQARCWGTQEDGWIPW